MTTNIEYARIKVKKISPEKVEQLIQSENPFILDVRPKNFSLNNQFIKGAYHIPLLFLMDRSAKIPKDRKIIVTDWAMKQSTIATKYLVTNGFNVIGVLKGGIERWNAENRPVDRREVQAPAAGGGDFK